MNKKVTHNKTDVLNALEEKRNRLYLRAMRVAPAFKAKKQKLLDEITYINTLIKEYKK
jgi:hypothetical protein